MEMQDSNKSEKEVGKIIASARLQWPMMRSPPRVLVIRPHVGQYILSHVFLNQKPSIIPPPTAHT